MRFALLLLNFLAMGTAGGSSFPSATPDREIIQVFDRTIELNEAVKKSMLLPSVDANAKARHKFEAYYGAKTLPALKRAPKELVSLQPLMRLSVSLQNSADETLSTTVTKAFTQRPEDFEKAYQTLSLEDKKRVYNHLAFGWEEQPGDATLMKRMESLRPE